MALTDQLARQRKRDGAERSMNLLISLPALGLRLLTGAMEP